MIYDTILYGELIQLYHSTFKEDEGMERSKAAVHVEGSPRRVQYRTPVLSAFPETTVPPIVLLGSESRLLPGICNTRDHLVAEVLAGHQRIFGLALNLLFLQLMLR